MDGKYAAFVGGVLGNTVEKIATYDALKYGARERNLIITSLIPHWGLVTSLLLAWSIATISLILSYEKKQTTSVPLYVISALYVMIAGWNVTNLLLHHYQNLLMF
jgi:hypothetical protein